MNNYISSEIVISPKVKLLFHRKRNCYFTRSNSCGTPFVFSSEFLRKSPRIKNYCSVMTSYIIRSVMLSSCMLEEGDLSAHFRRFSDGYKKPIENEIIGYSMFFNRYRLYFIRVKECSLSFHWCFALLKNMIKLFYTHEL